MDLAGSPLASAFSYLGIPIFQRALFAGSVLALLGVLVTARGLAYPGDGLSHAAFGGIALGMFLGLEAPLYVAIPFTALAAIAILVLALLFAVAIGGRRLRRA